MFKINYNTRINTYLLFSLIVIMAIGLLACNQAQIVVNEPIDRKFTVSEYLQYANIECEELLKEDEILEIRKSPSRSCLSIVQNKVNNSPLEIQRIANMNIARANPTTITLNNSNALIIGGDSDNSIEIFDNKLQNFKIVRLNMNSFTNEKYNKLCTQNFYLGNEGIFFRGLVYDQNENTFSKPLKKLKNMCNKLSKNTIIGNYNNGQILIERKIVNNKKFKELLLFDVLNNKELFKPVKIKYNEFYENSLKLDEYRFLLKKVLYIPKNTTSQAQSNNNLEKKELFFIYDAKNAQISELVKLNESFDSGSIYNLLFSKKNNEIMFNVAMPEVYNKVFSYNFSDQEVNEIAILPDNKRFNMPYKAMIFDDSYILYFARGVIFIIDLENDKDYLLLNANINAFAYRSNIELKFGQAYTELFNGEVLITGGYEDIQILKTEYNRNKYAAIINKKKIIKEFDNVK